MNKVLFATDYSPASQGVLPCAAAVAMGFGASLLIVHVEPCISSFDSGLDHKRGSEPRWQHLVEELAAVVPADSRVVCEHRRLMGDPATEIVRLADEEHVQAIVVGTHGRTGLSRLLMGSVAEAVVRRAKCPVIICRLPDLVQLSTTDRLDGPSSARSDRSGKERVESAR
ncbi:MAG TPA: universal stress protein [Pirellulales bacterium]|nr:universal stress protein [Pirellulales bacterium]